MDYQKQRKQALDLLRQDPQAALARLGQLCRLNPDQASAWCDMGLAQMQLDLDTRGWTQIQTLESFEHAIELAPDNQSIRRSYDLCMKNQLDKNFNGKIEHYCMPLPAFPRGQPKAYFMQMLGNAFVVRNALPAEKLEFLSLDYLREAAGDIMVDFIPPDSNFQFDKTILPDRILMRNALEIVEKNKSTYVMWNMKYRERNEIFERLGMLDKIQVDEYWIDNIIPSDKLRDELLQKTHWYQMVIGSMNAGMFNHYDVFLNNGWHLHVKGRKRWHISHPDNSFNIRKYTRDGAGEVNCFSPNYHSHPNFRKVIAYLDELATGDILYYPGCFWHQTQNMDEVNITLTCSSVDASNVSNVIQAVESCCERGVPYRFSAELCAAMQDVQAYWKDKYRLNTSNNPT